MTIAVVNARGSTMERLADIVLTAGAGPEILAVVSTKRAHGSTGCPLFAFDVSQK